MNEQEEQDRFYTSISEYYAAIFPFNSDQLEFVKKNSGSLNGRRILDIGCGTGELAGRMAAEGAIVTGIDLNERFLKQAKEKNSHLNVTFFTANMLDTGNLFPPGHFDSVICFGNTLVHLSGLKEIRALVEGVKSVLHSGGRFLLQILHYEYILEAKPEALPVIENEDFKFVRNYLYPEGSEFIRFKTTLLVKKNQKSIENETSLYPVKWKELEHILNDAGFYEIKFYSGFKMTPVGGNHLPLVVSCRK